MKNKIYVFLFLLFSSIAASGQAPDWQWAKSGTGNHSDHGMGISTDINGNSYITGYFHSASIAFDSVTLTNPGGVAYTCDAFIAKYDPSGNLLWAKNASGIDSDCGFAIATDAGGNSYITGFYKSDTITFGSTVLINTGGPNPYDIFIVKYDTWGNVLWARNAGGIYADEGLGMAIDAAGNLYVTGAFESPTIAFGGITLTNTGYADIFIAKYDSSGNVIWAINPIGNDYDYAMGIATDLTGNFYITGSFNSANIDFGGISLTLLSDPDIFIAKYDSSGNVLWAKSAGSYNFETGNSVAVDATGNSYITGNFQSGVCNFGSIQLINAGNSDMFIAKYDPSGNVLWAKNGGGAGYDLSSSISLDANGEPAITGYFQGDSAAFDNITLTNTDSAGLTSDIFVAKYDGSGNALWAKPAGGVYGDDRGTGITYDQNGDMLVSGYFNGAVPVNFSTITLTNMSGGIDAFAAKLDDATGVAETVFPFISLTVFPNPGNGEVSITSADAIDEIRIRNVLGQIIYSVKPGERNVSLKMDDSGIYFVTISAGKQTITKKVVVQR